MGRNAIGYLGWGIQMGRGGVGLYGVVWDECDGVGWRRVEWDETRQDGIRLGRVG